MPCTATCRPFVQNLFRNICSFVLLILALSLSSLPSLAQGTAGRISGAVTDQTGGAIAGATVNVLDVARGTTRTLTSDQSGEYSAPNLLPGNYTVSATFQGFKTAERAGVTLEVNGDLRIDLTLQPGEQNQRVTVTEALPMVDTTSATLGGTIQSDVISDLPLNGRNFENLLQLRPGVTIYPGGSGWTQSTNGQRPHDNVYMVNGIIASDPWMGQSVFNAVEAAGDAGTILPVDAIDEFKTQENPAAEYGWKPGAVVNVGIKSGTNSLHGSGYAYGRDTSFDARNFFNAPYLTPSAQQPVALEQFGGTAGGPIRKDKIFFFTNYEGQRYTLGNPDIHKVPETIADSVNPSQSLISSCQAARTAGQLTALSASLAGLSNTCTVLPGQPAGGFQGLFPVNNKTSTGFSTDSESNNQVDGGLGKINYHVNDKHSLEGMFFISQGDALTTDNAVIQISPQWLTIQHARSEATSADWTWTPNSNRVNEVRFGYAHYYQLFASNDHTQDPANYNFSGHTYEMPTGVTNPFTFGFPAITISGFNNGIGASWPKLVGPDGVLQLVDHYSILHGKHSFMLGAEWLSNVSNEDVTANAKGPLKFPDLVSFFEGLPNKAQLLTGNPARNLSSQNFAAFVQDDWRVIPRLTLNLGLRWEYDGVVHDQNNQLANFDPIRGLVQVGAGITTPYNPDYRNFSPRLGFAWDISGNGKTVLRGGASIIGEQMSYDVLEGVGNLLGLRSIPTGEPLYNNGSTTASPINGNIILSGLTFSKGALTPIANAWQTFNPAQPVSSQPTLYSSVTNPSCGDGVTQPNQSQPAPPPCSILGVDPNLRVPYVENWNIDVQRAITSNLSIDIGYVGNHGVKLLGKLDENQPQNIGGFSPGWGNPADPTSAAAVCINSGPAYDICSPNAAAEQAAQPFTAPCRPTAGSPLANLLAGSPITTGGLFNPNNSCLSYLQYVTIVNNGFESRYNGLQITLTGRNYHGVSFTSGYTYSHSNGEASDQGTSGYFPIPLNSYGNIKSQLYSPTQFDIHSRFTLSATYNLPSPKRFNQLLGGWSITSIVLIQSGSPWGLSDGTNDFTGTDEVNNTSAGTVGEQWNFFGNPGDFTPIKGWVNTNGGILAGGNGGVPFFGGTSNAACLAKAQAIGKLAVASLTNNGCFAVGSSVLIPAAYGSMGNTLPDMFRDAGFWNWDFSVIKKVAIRERLNAEFRAEFFNVVNHPSFSNPTGGPGGGTGDPSNGAGFGFSGSTPDVLSSNPEIGSGGPRSIQLGLKLTF